jgi:uncharacterized phage-like protein YoqJ
MSQLIVAGTGHRPDKIRIGSRNAYDEAVALRLMQFAMRCLTKLQPELVISGMALGWDQALAAAAVWLKIPFDAYVPFTGQESMWPQASQRQYRALLAKARRTVMSCEGSYAAWKMQRRNQDMVGACTTLLALWDGSPGGTGNCVRWAQIQADRTGKPTIHNVWPAWERHALRTS